MTRTPYYMVRTAEGFIGYWDGDLLAGNDLSLNCPQSKAYTFADVNEALLYASRLPGSVVIDRDGNIVPPPDTSTDYLAETDGLL